MIKKNQMFSECNPYRNYTTINTFIMFFVVCVALTSAPVCETCQHVLMAMPVCFSLYISIISINSRFSLTFFVFFTPMRTTTFHRQI